MTTDPIPTHDVGLPYAERYAQAVSIATAAQTRIDALTEQIRDHEWHRAQAENQVDALRTIIDLNDGQLIASTDAAPGVDVASLIDLHSGQVWTRQSRHNGSIDYHYWVQADISGNAMRYEWPLPDSGPFIPLPDDYFIAALTRRVRAQGQGAIQIRDLLDRRPGYPDGFISEVDIPGLVVALKSVLEAMERKYLDYYSRAAEADQRTHDLRRRITALLDATNTRSELEASLRDLLAG